MENAFQLCLNNYVCKNSLLPCALQQYNEKSKINKQYTNIQQLLQTSKNSIQFIWYC